MTSAKHLLIGMILILLMTLCACGTTESSEIETMQVDPAILSMIEAQEYEEAVDSIDAMEADAVVSVAEMVTELDAEGAQETATEQLAVGGTDAPAVTEESATAIKTYTDAYTVANTTYDGWILTLLRFDRSWYEETQSVKSGSWPIWDYGVTHYPYARDHDSIYMLSLPMTADTDTGSEACCSSYKAAQEDTLNVLKDYAKNNGLTMNPNLDRDYDIFLSNLWANSQGESVTGAPEDLLLEKLNGASEVGNIPQAARDAFYSYLSAREALFEEVAQWKWSLTEDTKSKHTRGWISLNFDGTPDTPGAYYGTSIYYRPDTGDVLNFEEMDAYIRSMEAEIVSNPAISGKLQSAFSALGRYDQGAFDAMLTFLSTTEGNWMWEKCRDWSWSCSYDASTDRYTLECVGPQEADGTKGVQYLVAQGSEIISYASSYISAPENPMPQTDDVAEELSVDVEPGEAAEP